MSLTAVEYYKLLTGVNLVAAVPNAGTFYASGDSGATWNANGGGRLLRSADGGASFSFTGQRLAWLDVCMSADGSIGYAITGPAGSSFSIP